MYASRPLLHLLQPMGIGANLGSTFAVEVPDIGADVLVVRFPRVEMAEQQVMLAPPGFTERDQVLGIKLQMRMKVEGLDVMHL